MMKLILAIGDLNGTHKEPTSVLLESYFREKFRQTWPFYGTNSFIEALEFYICLPSKMRY